MSPRTLVLGILCGLILALPAAANAAPPNVTAMPASVDFGAQSVEQSTPSTEIQFHNLSADPINVDSFGLSGPDSDQFQVDFNGCSPQTLFVGNWCNVYVYLKPTEVGTFSASADIVTDQGTEAVPLSGEGAAGSFSGTAPSYQPQPYFYGSQYGSAQFQNTDPFFSLQGFDATITGPDAAFFSLAYNGCQNGTWWPGNTCNVDVYFNPTGPGSKTAQLNLFNSGDPNPASVPLVATALNGPQISLAPKEHDFGSVAIGSNGPIQQFRIENEGDFPLEVQQVFVVGSSVHAFPLSDNQCDGRLVNPSGACTFDVGFSPEASGPGRQNGSLFVITNSPGPVSQGSLAGVAYEPPDGNLTLQGKAMALRRMTCRTNGFPAGTEFDYSWFSGNTEVGSSRTYRVSNRDVGSRLSCSVVASNPAESRTVTSPKSAAVVPAALSGMPGGLVGEPVCRAIQAPTKIGPGTIRYGVPSTPSKPLVVKGKGKLTATLDGQVLADGQGKLRIPPRRLKGFADGGHTLSVSSGGQAGQAEIALSGCRLAARAVRHGSGSTFKASSSVGMKQLVIKAGRGSHFSPQRVAGRVYVKALGNPGEVFLLSGPRTSSNQISVRVSKGRIQIGGLPANTGVVRLTLDRRSFTGRKVSLKADLKSLGTQKVEIAAVRRR